MKRLVIVGAGPFAEVAYECFTRDSEYEVVGFAVEAAHRTTDLLCDLPVVDFESVASRYDPAEHFAYVAIVYTQLNRVRARLAAAARNLGYRLASYVSSSALLWHNVEIGEHCFIFENNVLQPFVRIGRNVVLWSGNYICHHSRIRDNCFVATRTVISGSVDIGENSIIGVNATLVNDITIGRDSWIGPSVVITRDVPAGSVYRPLHSELREITSYDLFGVRRSIGEQ